MLILCFVLICSRNRPVAHSPVCVVFSWGSIGWHCPRCPPMLLPIPPRSIYTCFVHSSLFSHVPLAVPCPSSNQTGPSRRRCLLSRICSDLTGSNTHRICNHPSVRMFGSTPCCHWVTIVWLSNRTNLSAPVPTVPDIPMMGCLLKSS